MTPRPTSSAAADALRQALLADRAQTLTQLYRQAFPPVRRYVGRHGGSEQDAQDVFQDALVLLYERSVAGTLQLTAPPGAYLLGTARHLWQHEQRRRARLPTAPLTSDAEPAADAAAAELAPDLLTYVAQLGARCRDLLLAFYYFGQPLSQLAGEFGYRSVRSATVQKFKCLERLRAAVRAALASETIPA